MKRAVIAPLCSALVIPGLGQLINRQPGKATLLILGVSAVLLVAVFAILYKFNAAVASASLSGVPEGQLMATAMETMRSQGLGALAWLAGLYALVWLYAVVDAARWGLRLDRQAKEG